MSEQYAKINESGAVELYKSPVEGAVKVPPRDADFGTIKAFVESASPALVVPTAPRTTGKRGLHMIKERDQMVASLKLRGCTLFD